MKKFLALCLAAIMVLAMFVACVDQKTDDPTAAPTQSGETTNPTDSGETTEPTVEPTADDLATPIVRPTSWERENEEIVYNMVLPKFEEMMATAAAGKTADEKFVLYAQAEAYLLSTGLMIPTTTQGGTYQISRIAPHSVPYANWGNDDDRLHGLVISDEFLTKEERADLLKMWNDAKNGNGTYDPATYITGKGHKLKDTYNYTFSTAPKTIDWGNTSSQSDTEVTVNCVEGLVEYDTVGQLQPALAEKWTESEDGKTYTFNIRKGVKWYNSEGREVAELTAHDFVAGFQHMLDASAGLEFLVDGKVVGVTAYLKEGGSFENVGCKATDDYTLVFTLEEPVTYFMTMLTYSCFLPICKSFYESRGGVFGRDAYKDAVQDTTKYTFGLATDVSSQVYCGPFLLQKLQPKSEILVVKNENYYNADKVTLKSIKWILDDGSNPTAFYDATIAGTYDAVGLGATNGLLDKAKADGNFDKYAYITDTTSTTYFGGLNVNRGTWQLASGACASSQTEAQKIDTHLALLNQNFRLALQYAFDKATYNGVSRGEDLKLNSLRNMYCHPEFVWLENDTTDAEGHVFKANTVYGDLVQYYVTNWYKMPIDVHDGVNGWFHPEEAKQHLAKAVEQLGEAVNWPVTIDVVYLGTSESNANQANAYKQVVEGTLGTERVVVNLIKAETLDDFYDCGYRASHGVDGNFDMFYGSGWGPDYGDPSTYLETFLGRGAGYMTKVIGLF